MTDQAIVNTKDCARLKPLLASGLISPPAHRLRCLLKEAKRVDPRRVPPDVVTMNSRVHVRYFGDDAADVVELAYPDSNPDGLSVLSPLGAALLGAREGASVACAGGRISNHVTVERIEYQPERERHFDR